MKKELKKAILEGTLYDFIANNGHQMSKSDLIDIIKNLNFTVYQLFEHSYIKNAEDFNKQLIDNLNDYDFFEEE